jgi:hypothetical protein
MTPGRSSPSDSAATVERRCIGFGEREGVCENAAGGPPRDNPIWCGECDTARIEHISAQFQKIEEGFRGR